MTFALDILTALGLGAACGLRPFLPALAAGAFASADAALDFDGTGYAFLEARWWLLLMAVGLVATVLLARFIPELGLWIAGLAIGGALGAATLEDHGHAAIVGYVVAIPAALVAAAALSDLFGRVRKRLDAQAAGALPLYAEGAALLLAAIAIVVPPLSVVAVAFFAWLLAGGRRRAGEKYAGLRVLR